MARGKDKDKGNDKNDKPSKKEAKKQLDEAFKSWRNDIDSEPYIKGNPASTQKEDDE
jgi:hypothetical protein